MDLTYELVKKQISKLDKNLCKDLEVSDEGKKFSLLMLKKLSGYKKNELKRFYSDGSGDCQIDGVYILKDGEELKINVITCEFKSNNKPIGDKDVTDLIHNGLEYLLFGKDVPNLNPQIKAIKDELDDLRKEYQEKFAIIVKFISTADKVLSNNGESAFLKFMSDLQSKGFEIDYEKINGQQVSALFSSRAVQNTPIPIKLSGRSYYTLTGKEGFVCRLPVAQILNIYFGFEEGGKKYPGYGDCLFEDNVRKNLGLEKKVNQKIYDTATDLKQAIDFEYFNNGLTIVYDDKSGSFGGDSPILYLKGLQVVNGCQTINALIKAQENKKLSDDIYLTCRFIKRSDDKEFIRSVITYTNSQNAISDRDLHANDPVQYNIQTILKDINIFYERKLNEFRNEEDANRLDALDAAQAYYCCELQEPHHAKQEKRRLFNEYYHKVFDGSKDDLAYKLLLSYRILEYVSEKKLHLLSKKRKSKKQGKNPRYKLQDLIIAHGSYHIATNIYDKLFFGKSLDETRRFAKTMKLPKKIDVLYKQVLSDWEKYIEEQNKDKGQLDKFFKSNGKCF